MIGRRPHAHYIVGITLGLGMLALAGPVMAQNSLDTITDQFRSGSSAWGPALRNYAIGLFGLLALINFGYSFIKLALKGADLGEFLTEFVQQLLFIGLFLWLMLGSAEFSSAIVNSFREAGSAAAQAGGGTGGIRPSDIWSAGSTAAARIFEADYGWDVGKAVGMAVCGIVVMVCFALMAAALILALVESYIVMNASVLLMGFGGSRWTKDIAIKTLQYAVSVGAKLLTIQLIVGMAEVIVKNWVAAMPEGAVENMVLLMEMIGVAIVLLCLTFTIPGIVQGVVNGTSTSSGAQMVAAGAAVAAGVGAAAAGVAGAGMAMGGASKLASAQIAAGGGGAGGLAGVGQHAAKTLGNLAGGQVQDLGNKLSGRTRGGNSGARAGMAQGEEAKAIRASAAQASGNPTSTGKGGTGSGGPGPSGGAPSGGAPSGGAAGMDTDGGGSIRPADGEVGAGNDPQADLEPATPLQNRIGKIASSALMGHGEAGDTTSGSLPPELAGAPPIGDYSRGSDTGNSGPETPQGRAGLPKPKPKPAAFGKRPLTSSVPSDTDPTQGGRTEPLLSAASTSNPDTDEGAN